MPTAWETGNSTTDAKVNAVDMLAARDNQRSFLEPAPLDFVFDFDRNTRVNATDMLIARNNTTHLFNALNLNTGPAAKPLLEDAPVGGQAPAWLSWVHELEPASASTRRLREYGPMDTAVRLAWSDDQP